MKHLIKARSGAMTARRAWNYLRSAAFGVLPLALTVSGCGRPPENASVTLMNVSYDPTRELYREFNEAFAAHWQAETGQTVAVRMSHGGSGSQARAVIDGLPADVVTLALAQDIDAIAAQAGLLPADWQSRLPENSSPYTSTLAFLVRKGNPKNIRSWDDLVRADVQVITPNPKTSGVARWNYLAAWGYILHRELGGDATALADPARAAAVAAAQAKARDFILALYRNVPVLDTAARAATNTFMQRGIGDVLINWENEILLGGKELDAANCDIVIPPVSMLAEPTVALVAANADRHGTTAVAAAYLEFLYSDPGQRLAAKHFYRPRDQQVLRDNADRFPAIALFTLADWFGDWQQAHATHFADGAEFDRILHTIHAGK